MRTATAHLRSLTPYSQSKHITEPKKDKESAEDHEKRCWRHRIHQDAEGNVFIPQMSLKFSLATAAKYLRIRIPGKDRSEYTKHFESGVLCIEHLTLPFKAEDVDGEWLFLNANGKRGSGSRVWRCMPRITNWEGQVTYTIIDDIIPNEVFERVLNESGNFIGIGRFRPENGGFYGRFEVADVQWTEL